MPSKLPKPKPKRSNDSQDSDSAEKEKNYTPSNTQSANGLVVGEEDQNSEAEKKEKTYTPPNDLGLPMAKFIPDELLQNALQQAAGSWEKDNDPDEIKIKRIKPKILIIVGSLILIMLCWVLYEVVSDTAPQEQGQGIIKVPLPTEFVAREDELKKSATNFLAAKRWSDVLPYVRKTPGIEDKLKIYQERSPKESVNVNLFRPVDVIRVRDGNILYMLGVQDENEKFTKLYFTDQKPHAIIWEALVAYCDEPFKTLNSSKDPLLNEGTYRVYAKADGYYSGAYDEREWQAIKLTYPNDDTNILAYVKRNSEQGKKMRPFLYAREDSVPLILLIKPSSGKESNKSPEIIDLLGVGWHEL